MLNSRVSTCERTQVEDKSIEGEKREEEKRRDEREVEARDKTRLGWECSCADDVMRGWK